jgi:hypothetical protein
VGVREVYAVNATPPRSKKAQYNILRILRGEGKPLPILEIASCTITVVPGITGLIDRLERAGFVHRLRCEKDRRVIYVALTDQGTNKKTIFESFPGPLTLLGRLLLGTIVSLAFQASPS